MVDVALEHDRLLECLQAHADARKAEGFDQVDVYDHVPEDPRTDGAGRVLPHVILWGHIGEDVADDLRPVTWAGGGDQQWKPQVTLVAGLPYWVLSGVPVVRAALAEFRTSTGEVLLEDQGGPRNPTKDPDESDTPRWFAVLPLRTLLTA